MNRPVPQVVFLSPDAPAPAPPAADPQPLPQLVSRRRDTSLEELKAAIDRSVAFRRSQSKKENPRAR